MAIFTVKRINKRDPETLFTVAKVEFIVHPDTPAPTRDHVVMGQFPSIYEGDDFQAEGEWVDTRRYGYRYEVQSPVKVRPQTEKGMQKFLRRHVTNLGETMARRLVDEFGLSCIDTILSHPDRLMSVKAMTKPKAEGILKDLKEHVAFDEVSVFVMAHRGNLDIANYLYQEFGSEAIHKLRENPYVLVGREEIDFEQVERIANSLQHPIDSDHRWRAAVRDYLSYLAEQEGHLYQYRDILVKEVGRHIARYQTRTRLSKQEEYQLTERAIDWLLENSNLVADFDDSERECIFLRLYHAMETKIVGRLTSLVSHHFGMLVSAGDVQAYLSQMETGGQRFAVKQRQAVEMALTRGVSILTGGPGTGKTHTVKTIIECLRHHKKGAVVHLLAPTGKASKRMEEMAKQVASTIHSAVGYGGPNEGKVELTGDLIVVDESSMMDVFICHRLVEAIQEGVAILFVGDVNQLPPVGPGLVFRDLIESGRIPTTELDELFRQAAGGQININAHKLKDGMTSQSKDGISLKDPGGEFFFLEKKGDDHEGIYDMIERSIRQLLKKGTPRRQIQVLTPLKRGELGVWVLNRRLQAAFNPDAEEIENPYDPGSYFRVGDPVIHTENNKELGVNNGEVGEIEAIIHHEDHGLIVRVWFTEERTVDYGIRDLEQLELCYAMTVHKSQGSEYDVVIMPFSVLADGMLNRNLVYTGWTRAKKMLINIGSSDLLDRAARRKDQQVRNSLIERRLRLLVNPLETLLKTG